MDNYENNQPQQTTYEADTGNENKQNTNAFAAYYAQTAPKVYVPNKNIFRIAAVISYIIGFFYFKYVFGTIGWDPTVFTNNKGLPYLIFGIVFVIGCEAFAHFTGTTYEYLREKNRSVMEAVIFMVCVLVQSVALCLWGFREDWVACTFQVFMWHATIIYYVLARCGVLSAGRSGILFPIDCLQGFIVVPFGNFALRLETIFRRGDMKEDPEEKEIKAPKFKITARGVITVLLSLFIALIVCIFAFTQLAEVSETFEGLSDSISDTFSKIFGEGFWNWFSDNLFTLIISLPFGCFLFGLVAGALKSKKPEIPEAFFNSCTKGLHQLPDYSAYIIIGSISFLYLVFFGTALYDFINNQGLFAATAHEASTRAVASFWSLIRVILLNFAIMFGSCIFSRDALWEKKGTRIIATVLFVFALGFALLGLYNLCVVYMGSYGFTAKRVLSTWVEGNIIVWCVLMIVRLYKKIPAAQIGLLLGAISFSVVMLAKF